MKKKKPAQKAKRTRDPLADLNRAIRACEDGQLVDAQRACQSALRQSPAWPQALHLMGVICFRQGNSEQAIKHLQEAIRQEPGYGPAYNDLGNMLHEQGLCDEAVEAYKRQIELEPTLPTGPNNLGIILKEKGEVAEAITLFQRALELDKNHLPATLNLGYAYLTQEDLPAAATAFETAAKLAPKNSEPLRVLAHIYRIVADDDKTLATYQRWLAIEPNCGIAQHMLNAYTSEQSPARATDEFVREEFDRFADSFDEKLSLLKYCAPELVCREVQRHFPTPDRSLDILDAGCGTGLVGIELRPFARTLTGVDLSGGMLAQARLRNIYDELVERELVTFLKGTPEAFDLITVIETLIYFGDLQEPLKVFAAALRPDGNLVFTLESAEDPATEFRLMRSGRYVHGQKYIEDCLSAAGFADPEIVEVELREEKGKSVHGFLVWCGRKRPLDG